jgi:prophage antirepressor-like protein
VATWLSEPGIYRLLMGSEQPKAKQFAYFITDKLLPGIRAKLTEADTCIIK